MGDNIEFWNSLWIIMVSKYGYFFFGIWYLRKIKWKSMFFFVLFVLIWFYGIGLWCGNGDLEIRIILCIYIICIYILFMFWLLINGIII